MWVLRDATLVNLENVYRISEADATTLAFALNYAASDDDPGVELMIFETPQEKVDAFKKILHALQIGTKICTLE